ncbi:leucine-rich repeat-containing protein 18-like [Astyanax mexicanus]|uniref:Leucine rich repeat containing 18 n=1 Tax=Astyanax mexicanus TaxID=7994 RepID=A0A8B9JFV3_ASTMX|nr:leucine-rich repeat-containing protein 18-like [Astyanax mexicanus]
MAKGKKKSSESKGKKITLKIAKNAVKLTVDGKRRLDLSNMEIATFPKCILKLCDVEELDLSRNFLKDIPESIDRFVNMRWLDLHSNNLEKLPEALGRLQGLHSLNVCNNRLTTHGIPHELGLLRGLRSLNLGMNRIEIVPSSIGALKELRQLRLFNNLLTRVPPWLHSLPNLQTLNIKCNPITPDSPPPLDLNERAECLCVVSEDSLCEECLLKHKEKKGRIDHWINEAPVNRKIIPVGLITPNSVAQQDPAVHR